MSDDELKWPWFQRRFDFDFPPEKMPDIVERLRGTPPRVKHLLSDCESHVLRIRVDDTWSIQENIGHLGCIEPLWIHRIEDIFGGQSEMRDADLTNSPTSEANFNEAPIEEVLSAFWVVRQQMLDILEGLDLSQIAMASLHPRLKTPMRVVDLALFVAEHDDYHLARISYLMRRLC